MPVRLWKRVRALELLDEGWAPTLAAAALRTYRREIRRIGWRYLEGGLAHSLTDEPRPKPQPMLSTSQRAALTAMVCGSPPEGGARWSVRLIAEEAVSRAVVAKIGRETIRRFLASHDLKPWREKKCGACLRSLPSTSSGWRTCSKSWSAQLTPRSQLSHWMSAPWSSTTTPATQRRCAGVVHGAATTNMFAAERPTSFASSSPRSAATCPTPRPTERRRNSPKRCAGSARPTPRPTPSISSWTT